MFGFIFGAACVAGLAFMAASGGGHGFHHHGFRRHGFRRHGGFRRWGLYSIFERLETTPGQEKAILNVVDSLRDKARNFAADARGARKDVASALRGDTFDEHGFAAIFDGQLGAVETLRDEFAKAAAVIHETLTDDQRRRLAELIESGPRWAHGYGRC